MPSPHNLQKKEGKHRTNEQSIIGPPILGAGYSPAIVYTHGTKGNACESQPKLAAELGLLLYTSSKSNHRYFTFFSAVLLALFKRKNNTYVAQISTYVLEYLHFVRLLKSEEANRNFFVGKIVFTLLLKCHPLVEN